jgi:hypothetical protein
MRPLDPAVDFLAVATGPDGRIYATGGFDGQVRSDRVSAFDAATGWWWVPSLMAKRDSHAAATGGDGRVYVLGGFVAGAATSTVEAFKP